MQTQLTPRRDQLRLIINADDFGFSRGITDGIIRAHLEGVVTSTSMMVNQPASEYAAEQRRIVPRLSIGVHLTITQGKPLLPPSLIPSLVDKQGRFYGESEAARRLSRWAVSPAEIEDEFRAQIQWMKQRGLVPTHADSHHHVHLYPPSLIAYRRALLKEGIRSSRAPRHWSGPRAGWIGGSHAGTPLRRIAVKGYLAVAQMIALRPFVLPDACLVGHPAYRRPLGVLGEGWIQTLQHIHPGTYELGCHPGIAEPGFSESDGFAERREVELSILTGSAFRDVIRQRPVDLISWADIQ